VHSKGARLASASLALLAVVAAPAARAAQPTYSATASATVVEVPVQVTKDGEPVRGLKAEDFELYDGRKRVTPTGFEMLDLAATQGAAAQSAQMPVSARRHFLLIFDLTFSEPSAISRARAAAKQMLAALHPADLVAVATYSTVSGPQLLVGFTPDRRQAALGIDTLGLPELFTPGTDPLRLVVAPTTTLRPTAAGTPDDTQMMQSIEHWGVAGSRGDRGYDEQVIRNFTKSFTNLAHVMAGIDGRKYVVFLSEGYDSSLVTGHDIQRRAEMNDQEETIQAASELNQDIPESGSDQDYGNTHTLDAIERMLEEFRRADCQIQAVDIAGLRLLAPEGRATPRNGRDSLLNMAKSTGGELYENVNDLAAAMGQMLRRTGVTYVLTFQPGELPNDGSFHKLRVELKNAPHGTQVVHRVGYYAPRPFGERQPLERVIDTASTVMGDEGGNLETSVVTAPFVNGGDRAYVPVVIEVPGASLLAGAKAKDGKLPVEIYVYAVDHDGAVQGFLTQNFGLDVSKGEAALRQGGLKFYGHLELPKGSYALRTLVRNDASGATAVRVTSLEVPAAGEPALLPAFITETPGRWVMVREKQTDGQPAAAYPFMFGDQPYVPTARPVVAAGQALPVIVQGYNLPVGAYKAAATVSSLDGKEIPGTALHMKAHEGGASGPLRLSGTLQPPTLAPGEYVLHVTLTDGSGTARASSMRFAVTPAAGS
jgi:VWFA-related protein